jgi:hypothetical protein
MPRNLDKLRRIESEIFRGMACLDDPSLLCCRAFYYNALTPV